MAEGLFAVLLFADVASAYYCAVRGLTARKQELHTSPQSNPPPSHAEGSEVARQLQEPTALSRANASPWLETLTAEFNHNTWMYLAGDGRPAVTRQGSRPGSSWADLFYGVTVPRIIALRDQLRSCYTQVAPTRTVRWDGRIDLSEPSCNPEDWTCQVDLEDVIWADDLAKCVPVEHAAEVGQVVAREAGLLADAFGAHGYTLSFGPSKTAAALAIRGKGSRGVRRSLFSAAAAIPILREEAGGASLPLVPTYRHLGVQVTATGCILPEIRQRVALAWAAFRQGRTRVFRNKRIATAKRGALLATHVLTKLLFASGAWPALGKGELGAFSHAVLSLYRQTLVIGPDGDQHLTHATVCALIQQPPPAVLLLVEQARYLLQLFQSAPVGLWALIRRDPLYIAHLRSVVSWLYGWLCNTTDLPDPLTDWGPWERLMSQWPGLYKAYVKRARGLELPRTTGLAALQALRRAIAQLLHGKDLEASQKATNYEEGCLQCRIAFPSRTAWACHASKLHGYRTAATLLASEAKRPVCAACGKLYASRARPGLSPFGPASCSAGV